MKLKINWKELGKQLWDAVKPFGARVLEMFQPDAPLSFTTEITETALRTRKGVGERFPFGTTQPFPCRRRRFRVFRGTKPKTRKEQDNETTGSPQGHEGQQLGDAGQRQGKARRLRALRPEGTGNHDECEGGVVEKWNGGKVRE